MLNEEATRIVLNAIELKESPANVNKFAKLIMVGVLKVVLQEDPTEEVERSRKIFDEIFEKGAITYEY